MTIVTDANGNALTTTYDSTWQLFPAQTQNALGHTASTADDWRLGVPTVVTDANGVPTMFVYDALGQPYEQYRDGNVANDPTVRWYYMDTVSPAQLAPFNIRSWQKPEMTHSGGSLGQRPFYDGLGREIQTRAARNVALDGISGLQDIVVTAHYDALGRVISQTVPYLVPQAGGKTPRRFSGEEHHLRLRRQRHHAPNAAPNIPARLRRRKPPNFRDRRGHCHIHLRW